MMTKRLPYINHHRPYKYQELRRKFRAGAETSAARGEEEYRNLLRSRERTTLATARSNTNLAASRENLAASRDSLVIPEESPPDNNKQQKGEARQPYSELRDQLNNRQTSLDQLKKRTEEGKNVYSFTLSKADRSKSEPVLFPPLSEKTKSGKGGQQAPPGVQNSNEDTPAHPTPAVEKKEKENKPISTVKFPIVSRYDLYKHLGISQTRRKRIRRDSEANEAKNNAKSKQPPVPPTSSQQQLQTPRIMPESSGRSRNPTVMYSTREDHKKLEMYKQWHEDQANQRRSHDYDTKEAARLASIYKERYQSDDIRTRNQERLPARSRRDATLPKIGLKDRSNAGRVIEAALEGSVTDRSRRDTQSQATNQRGESPPVPVPEELLNRKYSAKTWRTWRHHNDSYAYDDVDRYIEENELLDDEKIYFIRQWIASVAKAALENDKDSDDDDDDNDVGTTSSTDHTDRSIPESNFTKLHMPRV